MTTKAKPKPKKAARSQVTKPKSIMVVDNGNVEGVTKKLNPNQQAFCELYVSRDFLGNGTQAYIEAYNVDVTKGGAYAAARVSSHRLLTNANILARIDELLELAGLNDQFVDRQLTFWITQKADGSVAMKAIAEYNKLKKRVSPLPDDPSLNVLAIQYIAYPQELPDSAYSKYLED